MGRDLVKKGWNFTVRRKKWIITLGLVGLSGYGAYRIYQMPFVVRKRRRILKVFESLISIVEMVSDSSETVAVVSRDLKEFLKSESDEIPNSLKQMSKIAQSEEFSVALVRVTQAMVVGVLKGYNVEQNRGAVGELDGSTLSRRILDKLVSRDGTGFVSIVVGSFARNLVLGFYAGGGPSEGEVLSENSHSDASSMKAGTLAATPKWISVICDDKCRVLLADCVKTFVSSAVEVYLEKTMDVNFYNEIFAGLTNPNHQDKMTDVLVSLCNGAVKTLVKTSHQVLMASKQGSNSGLDNGRRKHSSLESNGDFKVGNGLRKDLNAEYVNLQSYSWVNSLSSTLAIQSNRKFVLDVTGQVTFETIRSVIKLLSWKICEGLKRSSNAVHDKVVERGFELVTHVGGAKSFVILTIGLALFLHITGKWQCPSFDPWIKINLFVR